MSCIRRIVEPGWLALLACLWAGGCDRATRVAVDSAVDLPPWALDGPSIDGAADAGPPADTLLVVDVKNISDGAEDIGEDTALRPDLGPADGGGDVTPDSAICDEPSLFVVGAPCDQQHPGCPTGGDNDCDGLGPLSDPNNSICHRVKFAEEFGTDPALSGRWLPTNGYGWQCGWLLLQPGVPLQLVTTPDPVASANRLLELRFRFSGSPPSGQPLVSVALSRDDGSVRRCRLIAQQANFHLQLHLELAGQPTVTTYVQLSLFSVLPDTDYIMTSHYDGSKHVCSLHPAGGGIGTGKNHTAPQLGGTSGTLILEGHYAGVTADHLRIFEQPL